MAAAIILIPEMLSGPDRTEHATQTVARTPSETGLKTYSIDLNNPPGSSSSTSAQAVPDERAPPPEEVSPAPAPAQESQPSTQNAAPPSSSEDEPNPEPAPQRPPTPQASEQAARVASTGAPSQAQAEKPTPRPVETPPARAPLASANSVPTSRGWAVQLGSFSNRASAEKLAAEFRAGRDDVFVMPVKSGATTLYRVRIGPMPERAAAEDTLRRVKTKVSGAAVVAHP